MIDLGVEVFATQGWPASQRTYAISDDLVSRVEQLYRFIVGISDEAGRVHSYRVGGGPELLCRSTVEVDVRREPVG